jgi:hypothetical protein
MIWMYFSDATLTFPQPLTAAAAAPRLQKGAGGGRIRSRAPEDRCRRFFELSPFVRRI